MILELRDHDVVEPLIGARDLGLEPGQFGLHFPYLAHKLDVLLTAHSPASTLLIHRRRFPASPAGKWTHSPDSVKRFPPYRYDQSVVTMAPGVRGTGLIATVGSAHRLQPPTRRVVTDSRTISLTALTIPPAKPQPEHIRQR